MPDSIPKPETRIAAHPLHSAQAALILASPADARAGRMDLLIGPAALASRHWPQGLKSPLQLERAIDDVETAIEALGWTYQRRGTLAVDAQLAKLLPALSLEPGLSISREALEHEFSRLVRDIHAAGPQGPVINASGAAVLLILREVMHHLGFDALSA
jgi:hypothetical protein